MLLIEHLPSNILFCQVNKNLYLVKNMTRLEPLRYLVLYKISSLPFADYFVFIYKIL